MPTKEKKTPSEKQLAHYAKMAQLRKGVTTTAQQIQSPTIVHMAQTEETVAEIKPYRHKKGELVIDEDKLYEFELCTKREEARPLDKEPPYLPMGTGFQPSFSIPNKGSAYNKKSGKFENWRYIEGQASCWVSEQPELEEYEPKDIDRLMGNPENDLEFRDGRMLVSGGEAGKLRMQAMFLSDFFIDNEKPRIKRPLMWQFKLNNPDAIIEQQNDYEDLAFRTMTQARGCTITEMLAVSLLLGINIDDADSPAGLNRIKNQFLGRAKYDAKNPKGLQFFMDVINNPDTKTKYLFAQGLLRGILSTTQHPGKLTWAKLNAPILDLAGKMQPVDELTGRVNDKEAIVIELLAELEAQLNKK